MGTTAQGRNDCHQVRSTCNNPPRHSRPHQPRHWFISHTTTMLSTTVAEKLSSVQPHFTDSTQHQVSRDHTGFIFRWNLSRTDPRQWKMITCSRLAKRGSAFYPHSKCMVTQCHILTLEDTSTQVIITQNLEEISFMSKPTVWYRYIQLLQKTKWSPISYLKENIKHTGCWCLTL